MDELDRIEGLRWAVFALVSLLSLVLFSSLTRSTLASVILSVATGLLGGGVAAAIAYTRPLAFSALQSEARYNGHAVSKVGIWMSAVLPALVAGAVGCSLLISF